jgi:hypothetical protein
MTRKPDDLGRWIAGLSAAAIIVAVIAGLFSVTNPLDARAQRIDAARLGAMQRIAQAAQCAFTFDDRVPATIADIRAGLRTAHAPVPTCGADIDATPEDAAGLAYAAEGADRIELCADFLRPTPRALAPEAALQAPSGAQFPELQEKRAAAGRHCFHLQLVRQPPQGE